jgi:uncharacterized protein
LQYPIQGDRVWPHETSEPAIHTTHPAIVKRLKRVARHLSAVISVIEDERSCVEVAQQLHAVENAISTAKNTLIHDHVDHCLDEAVAARQPAKRIALDQFKQITKYL